MKKSLFLSLLPLTLALLSTPSMTWGADEELQTFIKERAQKISNFALADLSQIQADLAKEESELRKRGGIVQGKLNVINELSGITQNQQRASNALSRILNAISAGQTETKTFLQFLDEKEEVGKADLLSYLGNCAGIFDFLIEGKSLYKGTSTVSFIPQVGNKTDAILSLFPWTVSQVDVTISLIGEYEHLRPADLTKDNTSLKVTLKTSARETVMFEKTLGALGKVPSMLPMTSPNGAYTLLVTLPKLYTNQEDGNGSVINADLCSNPKTLYFQVTKPEAHHALPSLSYFVNINMPPLLIDASPLSTYFQGQIDAWKIYPGDNVPVSVVHSIVAPISAKLASELNAKKEIYERISQTVDTLDAQLKA